jgi:DNA (cytosine-5)-methyltransferase 1
MSLGFEREGFDVVTALDNWSPAIAVYNENFSHAANELDIASNAAKSLVKEIAPDVIIGGPPCQDFSSAGPNNYDEKRASLIGSFVDCVQSSNPCAFVMENVPRARYARIYKDAISDLRSAGYALTEAVLDASFCGVPQARKRLFLVGIQGGDDDGLLPYLQHGQTKKPLTMREYFGDSLGIDHYFRIPTTYKRKAVFSVDEPAVTIRGIERPIPPNYVEHPDDPVPISSGVRTLSIAERAAAQTFPKEFRFFGTKTNMNQMIGNAVPVNLAQHVASSLRRALTGAAAELTGNNAA